MNEKYKLPVNLVSLRNDGYHNVYLIYLKLDHDRVDIKYQTFNYHHAVDVYMNLVVLYPDLKLSQVTISYNLINL